MKDFSRYQRQLLLPQMDEEKQQQIYQSKILVIGVGGLGCPLLTALTTAGIGNLGLVDFDKVSLSNLHRQFLFSEKDIGKYKVEVAKERLSGLNSEVLFKTFLEPISINNVFDIIAEYDVVVDCTDNFPTRYLVNDVCFLLKKPLVYAAIYQNEGQLSVFNYFVKGEMTTNLRDIFPQQPKQEDFANCNEAGVLGILTSIMGNFQANEVIKLIIGGKDLLTNKLLLFNSLNYQTQIINYTKNPLAISPSSKEEILKTLYGDICTLDFAIQTKEELDNWLAKPNSFLVDVREEDEYPDIKEEYQNIIQIPLPELEQRNDELMRCNFNSLIFVCQTGVRSKKALLWAKKKYPNKQLTHIEAGIRILFN